MNLIVNGANGRMGKAVLACAAADPKIQIVGKTGKFEGLAGRIEQADVVIDFSHHEATVSLAVVCANYRKPLVIGTTGHTAEELTAIHECSSRIPMIMESNFSVGMHLLFWLTHKTAMILGPDFDPEVVEMHHRNKKDAPSGSATTLAGILARVREVQTNASVIKHGRQGITGARGPHEIGVHAVRGGDVLGDHTVIFAGEGERIELAHKVTNRAVFAEGALAAAKWVAQPNVRTTPGLYRLKEVLGLPE